MLINKLPLNKQATECLGKYVEETIKTWFRYTVKKPLSYEDFSEWGLPKDEIKKALPCGLPLSEAMDAPPLIQARNILKADSVVNAFAYSPMSGMYWHTNSDMIGTRIYLYPISLTTTVPI